MRKFLSFLVVSFVAFLPFTVDATSLIVGAEHCTENTDGTIACVVGINIDESQPLETVTIKLTEAGGAEILKIENENNGFQINGNPSDENGVWNVELQSATLEPISGNNISLFKFTYKPSGLENCKVEVSFGEQKETVVPKPIPTPKCDPNDPTSQGYNANWETDGWEDACTKKVDPNPDTGVSLPFIALGVIAVIAGGAYLTTKNKSKIYKI